MKPLPDDILRSLGFYTAPSPYSDGEGWTHVRARGQFYWQILTPEQVQLILIEIGHAEMREAAQAAVASIEME